MDDYVMTRHVYSIKEDRVVRTEQDTPICGKDFCDTCGDCLACFGRDDSCYDDAHYWVVYEDDNGN